MRKAVGIFFVLLPFLVMNGAMVASVGVVSTLIVWGVVLAITASFFGGLYLIDQDR